MLSHCLVGVPLEVGWIFDLCYDRAPGSIDAEGQSRKGSWTLFRELRERSS